MANKKELLLTKDLRKDLKDFFASELKTLPDYFKELQTKEKLDYLIKLMPFVFPKVDNVTHENGEPGEFGYQQLK